MELIKSKRASENYLSKIVNITNFRKHNDLDSSREEYLWTADQFMNMATNWSYPNDWDGESYEKYEKERNPSYNGYEKFEDKENEEFWIKLGYNSSYYNFYNDGLRQSTCCEFS